MPTGTIEPGAQVFLEQRGIDAKTLMRWPVRGGSVQFGGESKNAVIFSYERAGTEVNWKARSLVGRKYMQKPGGKARFYNLDRVLQGPQDVVYITEGEIDAISLAVAGIPDHAILSVPNGAPSSEGEDVRDSAKFAYALDALEEGLNATSYVLCTDGDEPGRHLRHGLATCLGKARCWYLDWRGGVKDANDALQKWGPVELRRFVESEAKPWPIVGLYTLDELPEPPALELWNPGFPEWENKVRLAPTMLSVMTGYPGHGKSHFAQQLWHQIARDHGVRVAVFGAETPAKPYIRRHHRQFYHGRLERDQDDEEREQADRWISDHFVFLQHPNHRPTFAWLCETIEAARHRFGCRAAVIDPWNKLEADFDPRTQRETQWIGDCLDQLMDMARALDMHIQVVAHPAKPEPQAGKHPPNLYSISGSSHWNNRVDQGFAMYRPQIIGDDGNRRTEAEFYQLKARFEPLGFPTKCKMELDLQTGSYVSTDYRTW
jgi:twinkle protein